MYNKQEYSVNALSHRARFRVRIRVQVRKCISVQEFVISSTVLNTLGCRASK